MIDFESIKRQLRSRYIYRGVQLLLFSVFVILLLLTFYFIYTVDFDITLKVGTIMFILALIALTAVIKGISLFIKSPDLDINEIRESVILDSAGKSFKIDDNLYLEVYYSNMFDVLSNGDIIYTIKVDDFEYILPKEDMLSSIFFY